MTSFINNKIFKQEKGGIQRTYDIFKNIVNCTAHILFYSAQPFAQDTRIKFQQSNVEKRLWPKHIHTDRVVLQVFPG